jgi:hypothetical protein
MKGEQTLCTENPVAVATECENYFRISPTDKP